MRTERTFLVQCPQSAAVTYLADFANATEWDPGTQSCEPLGDGPVQVGSSWHNVSKLGPITTELTYTLEELTDDRVKQVGRNKTATSVDEITVTGQPDGRSAQISYVSDVTFHRFGFLAVLIMRPLFVRLAKKTVQDLTSALGKVGARQN